VERIYKQTLSLRRTPGQLRGDMRCDPNCFRCRRRMPTTDKYNSWRSDFWALYSCAYVFSSLFSYAMPWRSCSQCRLLLMP